MSLFLQDDKSALKAERLNVANLQFAITTGPGPAPELDGENIVFGRVTSGLGTVQEIATIPTFQPNENLQAFNRVASLLGDSRANETRQNLWGKPRQAILITATGAEKLAPEPEAPPQPQP